jgi:hypothetical protein
MFDFTTIIIICIFLLVSYFVYQLLIDNMKLTKKIELLISNKMEDLLEKIEETNDIINKKTDILNNKIKECYDLEFKMNELNILNNQKIVEKHDYQEDDNNNEISPITENFFIKNNNNKDKHLYYMSPIQKTSKNSNLISFSSTNTLSENTSNIEDLNKSIEDNIVNNIDNIDNLNLSKNDFTNNSFFENSSSDKVLLDNDLVEKILVDNELLNNNLNFLNNNLNFCNIIVNNNSENDITKIKPEDRFEEL